MVNRAGKILLVDDEEAVRLLYREALALKGYHAESAAGGEEALKMLSRSRWSLVISDVCMPGMSGMDLYEAVSREYPYLKERFLFITGKPMKREDLCRMKVKCLIKPFKLADLMDAVDRLMKRASAKTVHEDAERRKSLRLRRRIKCILHFGAPAGGAGRVDKTMPAITRDLSNDGMGIEYDEERPLEPHSLVNIAVDAPASSLNVRAKVIWSTPVKQGGWMTGLKFSEPQAAMPLTQGYATPAKKALEI